VPQREAWFELRKFPVRRGGLFDSPSPRYFGAPLLDVSLDDVVSVSDSVVFCEFADAPALDEAPLGCEI
jgi:hypothetical protein